MAAAAYPGTRLQPPWPACHAPFAAGTVARLDVPSIGAGRKNFKVFPFPKEGKDFVIFFDVTAGRPMYAGPMLCSPMRPPAPPLSNVQWPTSHCERSVGSSGQVV